MLLFAVGSTIDPPGSWWDDAFTWLNERNAGGRVLAVAVTVVVALAVWIGGRLVIRGLTRGIREGIPRAARREGRVERRNRSMSGRHAVHNRLEAERREQRARTIGVALRSLLSVTIVIIAATTTLSVAGIEIGPLLAAAGIVGVALGFGAQSLVKDLLSGIFILFEDQYGVGDTIDLGEASGSVEEVGLRVTRLRGLDGTVWFVPNGEIRRVANKSRLWSRAVVEVRVAYDADLEAAASALMEAATTATTRDAIAPHVLGAPLVPGVESVGADGAVLRVLVQVQPGQQWDVERAIRSEVQRVFRKRKILLVVPEPRMPGRDVR